MSDDVTTAATIASLRAEVERLKAELAAASEREESMNVQMRYVRQALDTASERAGVLRAEVRAWRNASDNYTGDVRIVYGQAGHIETIAAARAETDRTHALDAAKFGGA